MIIESYLSATTPLNATPDSTVISDDVLDAGSAKKLFEGGGSPRPLRVIGQCPCDGGSATTLKVEFVGDSNINLVTAAEILGSQELVAQASGSVFYWDFPIRGQVASKQYYGLRLTPSGTSASIAAGEYSVVADSQTEQFRVAAATP